MIKTPYYLLNLQRLSANLNGLRVAFSTLWSNFLIGYSFKTNNLPWLTKWMHLNGTFAEVVSSAEYQQAKRVGFPINNIIFNGPVKGNEALLEAVKNGAIVNLDNFEEIEYLIQNLDCKIEQYEVGIRINFDLESVCPAETIPGKEPGRFGFNVENGDFEKAIHLLKKAGIKVVGIHGHHSTRTKSLKVFSVITSEICLLLHFLDKVKYIDLGGCIFGDKPGAPSFDEYASTVINILKANKVPSSVKLIMEPGAALVASPFSYVCKVVSRKDINGTRLVFTDGSIKHITSQMNTIKFASNCSSKSENIIHRQIISGYTCIEMDRFLEYIDKPELEIGDTITVSNTGAYSLSLAPLFIEFFPQVVVNDHDKLKVVREVWSINEFMQNNILDQ